MLDPRSKASIAAFFFALAVYPYWELHGIAVVVMLGLLTFSPWFRPHSTKARQFFRRFIQYAMVLIFLVVTLNGLLTDEGHRHQILGLALSREGMLFGLSTALRLVLMSLSVLLYFLSTPIRVFADHLERSRLPQALVSIVLMAFAFLEAIPERIEQIIVAQESRGAAVRDNIFRRVFALPSIVGPLVLASLVESIERGTALQLRGYHYRLHSGIQAQTMRLRQPTVSMLFRLFVIIIL
ncbi:MAG: hypothetical protein HY966_05205, partial [Ignavibacteriales bacterium]|nr:hypothetical protein [Ignavibacteriales bacterium]